MTLPLANTAVDVSGSSVEPLPSKLSPPSELLLPLSDAWPRMQGVAAAAAASSGHLSKSVDTAAHSVETCCSMSLHWNWKFPDWISSTALSSCPPLAGLLTRLASELVC